MAMTDAVLRLEPLDLFQVLFVEHVFKKLKPVSHGLAVRFLDGREVRRWSLNFVGHEINITEWISGVHRLEENTVKGSS